MTVLYLLDTCTISDFFKGKDNTQQRIKDISPTRISISSITVMEVLYGFELNPAIKKKFSATFGSMRTVIRTIPFDEQIAETASMLRAELKNKGTPIGPWDLLIGATALAHDHILVTSNIKEFSRLTSLQLEDWR